MICSYYSSASNETLLLIPGAIQTNQPDFFFLIIIVCKGEGGKAFNKHFGILNRASLSTVSKDSYAGDYPAFHLELFHISPGEICKLEVLWQDSAWSSSSSFFSETSPLAFAAFNQL